LSLFPILGGTRSYFSGSGISLIYVENIAVESNITCINIELEPEVLESFFLNDHQWHSEPMQHFI
jgi:hypothetical protein